MKIMRSVLVKNRTISNGMDKRHMIGKWLLLWGV